MKYGLIGEHLGHSYSVPIHRMISGEDYELKEIAPADLGTFMTRKEFRAVNVTIPYKQDVIPYLDEISDTAREIGAVNTVVNRDGFLYGTNTDAAGLRALILRVCPDIRGKKTLVLGTGGPSKTAVYTARAMGADPVIRVSRSAREGAVTYGEALKDHADAEILINTTPCGMFPAGEDMPVDIDGFPGLRGVIDVIYNPLRTKLVLAAMRRGIPAEGGLYLLAAQAVRAAEIFRDTSYEETLAEQIYRRMARDKENIVLTGMPGSGKTAVSAILGKRTGRDVIDTDRMITEKAGMEITEIFSRYGEKHFRDLETEVIREAAARAGVIISTGGGAVLREENVDALRRNGRLVWLDRKPEDLIPTDDRPLADSREKMAAMYTAREPIYRATADERIGITGTAEDAALEIESRWNA